MNENVFEFLRNDKQMTVSLSQPSLITRFKKLAEEHPEDVWYVMNNDGSLFGHMPVSYLRLRAPNKLTDEQRDALAEKGREMFLRRKELLESKT